MLLIKASYELFLSHNSLAYGKTMQETQYFSYDKNHGFPVDFPLNQSSDDSPVARGPRIPSSFASVPGSWSLPRGGVECHDFAPGSLWRIDDNRDLDPWYTSIDS